MSETLDEKFLLLRIEADRAETALHRAVREACGNHRPYQRRDLRPPWCDNCGRDNDGFEWRARRPVAPHTAPLTPVHPPADHGDGSGAGGREGGEGA